LGVYEKTGLGRKDLTLGTDRFKAEVAALTNHLTEPENAAAKPGLNLLSPILSTSKTTVFSL
jgi:hypothetical protein